MNKRVTKEEIKQRLSDAVRFLYRRDLDTATKEQIYVGLCHVVRDRLMDAWIDSHQKIEDTDAKKLYYLSMEFLIGRTLGSNILNLDKEGTIEEALEDLGLTLNEIEDQERDPALGNGGLGRLAACFLDSLATLSYPAYGCGIRYHYGLFRQRIMDGYQVEVPDNWLKDGYPFEVRRSEYTCEVRFNGDVVTRWDGKRNYFELHNYKIVKAVPYEIPIIGHDGEFVSTLRVWEAEPVEEFNLQEFDEGHYMKAVEQENLANNLCDVLYPNDNHITGKELRLRQQYFFVSATVQTALKKYSERHDDIKNLAEKVVFHMNDTHPTLCVPELMRILLDEYLLEWDDAWKVTTECCCYTNHTIMPEALECWEVSLFQKLLPRVYQIVQEMNRRLLELVEKTEPGNQELKADVEILHDGKVRMPNIAIYGSKSINGVAEIHSGILQQYTFAGLYKLFPEKFGNKTNGITPRRFLWKANPLLSCWIDAKIGNDWQRDLRELQKLKEYVNDETALQELMAIKKENKKRLAKWIMEHNGIVVDPDSIFDVQVKRLHEYKRQLMNILHVMYIYNELKKNPLLDITPITFIFGAKAAPGYHLAKKIIKLINNVAAVINNDASIHDRIKVVFIEDYCVSTAELIFPASDISEQISTASKEASGTSNMKFMLNGAITLGTLDGANIEILEEAGEENEIIFGMNSMEVMAHEMSHDYDPKKIFESEPDIREIVLQLVNGTFSPDDPELFRDIYQSLIEGIGGAPADPYFVLADFKSYMEAYYEADRRYRNRSAWAKSSLLNIASSGKFSSDRTIQEYVDDYWHLEKMNED